MAARWRLCGARRADRLARMDIVPRQAPGWSLSCEGCGRRHAAFAAFRGCPDCARAGRASVMQVEGALPPLAAPGLASLGEGGTPLVRAPRIAARLGVGELFFKLEGANPTGSYKDRYVAATLAAVLPFGVDRVVVSSTGNLGVSVAAYAAAAGIPCLFLAAAGLPRAALVQAQAHGALVAMTDAQRRNVLFEHAALERGWFPVGLRMPRRVSNPFGVEGYRAIATEVVAALGRALGCHAERVTRTEDFAPAFRRALESGRAALVELLTDPEVVSTRLTITGLRERARQAAAKR